MNINPVFIPLNEEERLEMVLIVALGIAFPIPCVRVSSLVESKVRAIELTDTETYAVGNVNNVPEIVTVFLDLSNT